MSYYGASARSSPYDSGKSKWGGKGASDEKYENNPPSDNLYVMGLPVGTDDEFIKALFADYGTVMQCKVLPAKENSSIHALVRFSSEEEATNVKNTVAGGVVDGATEPLQLNYVGKAKRTDQQKGGYGGDKGGWGGDKGSSWGGDAGKGKSASWGKGDDGKSGGGWGKSDGKGKKADSNGKGGGKGKKGEVPMDVVLKAFHTAQCLPGCELGNDHNNLHIAGLPKDCTDVHLYRLFAPFGSIPQRGVTAMLHPDGTCKGFGFVNFIDASAMQAAVDMLDGAELPDGSILRVQQSKSK